VLEGIADPLLLIAVARRRSPGSDTQTSLLSAREKLLVRMKT